MNHLKEEEYVSLTRENHCGPYIKQIHDVLEKRANNSMRDKDLTMAQLQLLLFLCESESGGYPLKELEKLLHVSQATSAGIVRRLEQKGFIYGHTSADDKRVKFARITELGRAVCSSAIEDMERAENWLVTGLSAEEKTMFILLLKKVSNNLS
jgi:DNA-binding MarR family transcriptional regulator